MPKCQRRATAQKSTWRHFTQLRFADDQGQAGIATRHGVADPVALGAVEKEHLVCLGYGLVIVPMSNIDAAIWKHQLCGGCALFHGLVPAAPSAVRIPNRNS